MPPISRLFEVYPRDAKATVPYGYRVDDVIYAGSLPGTRPASGDAVGDAPAQMEEALKHVKTLMEKGGGSLDNVARCVGYVTTPEDRLAVYAPWDEFFPDSNDRPAFKVLTTELPRGHLAHIDVLGFVGKRRARIDIPNVPARDPSVKIGDWFFTSRCHGLNQIDGKLVDGGLEPQTNQAIDNLLTLVELAGGTPENITQVTMFGRDTEYIETAKSIFAERFPDPVTRPELHQILAFITARFEISMEMMAHIQEPSA
jgi:2-iminobutanoate/2-iminopropanoate deaminase